MRAAAWRRIAGFFNLALCLSHLFEHNCNTHITSDCTQKSASISLSLSLTHTHTPTHTHTHMPAQITCRDHFARPQWETPSTFTAGNRAMKHIPGTWLSLSPIHTVQMHLLRGGGLSESDMVATFVHLSCKDTVVKALCPSGA